MIHFYEVENGDILNILSCHRQICVAPSCSEFFLNMFFLPLTIFTLLLFDCELFY